MQQLFYHWSYSEEVPNRLSQQVILDVRLSDPQLICCVRKFARIKRSGHKEIKLCCLKSYAVDGCEKGLHKMEFTNYENVDNVNNAHSKLTQRSIEVIEEETCVKDKRIEQSSQEQFYSEILE